MNRRNFIRISSISSIGLFFSLSYCDSSDNNIVKLLSSPLTLSDIFDKSMLKNIGKRYLNEYTSETEKNKLTEKLLKNIDYKTANSKSIIRQISDKIKIDFKTDNIVNIDGWILSRTEARQCALSTLI